MAKMWSSLKDDIPNTSNTHVSFNYFNYNIQELAFVLVARRYCDGIDSYKCEFEFMVS